ncbi:MAG: hypothetical protein ACI3WQ_08835 [Faecousia sp.]
MAKSMAQIVDGVVSNILWCADNTRQSDTLIPVAERPVCIGDTYDGGKFWRDGGEVLTPLEAANAEIDRLRTENADMQSALEILEVAPDENVE